MITYMNEYDEEDARVLFSDVEIKLGGETYSCDGEAYYEDVIKDRDESGTFLLFEGLKLDVVLSSRWDEGVGDWVESPEMDDNEELLGELLDYLEA